MEEELWDDQVRSVQFAINNVVKKSTGKTPSQLLFGITPRNGSDALLRDEIMDIPDILEKLVTARHRRCKKPHSYKEGDLVVIMKQTPSTGTTRKLAPTYSGPMVVKAVLPSDRYIV